MTSYADDFKKTYSGDIHDAEMLAYESHTVAEFILESGIGPNDEKINLTTLHFIDGSSAYIDEHGVRVEVQL